jgi:nucleoside-triphosphatase THEP1
MQGKQILLLTGDVQTGKTTFLQNWVRHRNDTAGWLSPVIDGERFFYNIPEQVLYNMEAQAGEKDVLKVGKFIFSADVFLKTTEKLITWSNEKKWKYIIIDEIGPLELNQHKGLFNVLTLLMQNENSFFTLLLVIREGLLNQTIDFCANYNKKTKIIRLKEKNELLHELE